MEFLTNHAAGDKPLGEFALPQSAEMELTGVIRDASGLFAVFVVSGSQRILAVDADHLASFQAFRHHVRRELGIDVRHPAHTWAVSVCVASERGGAAA
jgi:hypothetical protein